MKYFFKQYWRYIAMALAFATFNFFINSCQVHALNNISSIQLNYNNTSTSEWQAMYNSSNNNLANFGRGKLIFTTLVYKDSPGTTFDVPGVVGIYAYSGNNLSTCETGSVNINEDGDDYIKGYMLNVVCDMNMGERGITQIVAQFETNSQNSWTTKTSFYMTFVSDLTLNNTQIIQEQEAYTRDVINNATNLINQTNTNLVTNILNAINTNHNAMYNLLLSKLDGQTQAINDNTQAVNDVNDSINNSNTNGGQTQANDFFNNFDGGQTGSLMDLVSLPLDFLNSLNNTCSPITLTLPFINQTFQLPCLRSSLTSAFGGIVSIIVLVINAIICYRLIKGFIDIIHNLKDPNNDEIEVMDL